MPDTANSTSPEPARHIPVELEGDCVEKAPLLGLRGTAQWLKANKGCDCTHGQVGRVVRRRLQQARLQVLEAELRADYQAARVDYRETAEVMLDLQLELVERMEEKEARDEIIPTLRTCHKTVSALQRQLRTARRDFISLNRPVASGSAPAPSSAALSTPTPEEVPSAPTPPVATAPATPTRLAVTTPTTRRWPAIAAFAAGWIASRCAVTISSLAGLYAPVRAVLAISALAILGPSSATLSTPAARVRPRVAAHQWRRLSGVRPAIVPKGVHRTDILPIEDQ